MWVCGDEYGMLETLSRLGSLLSATLALYQGQTC